MIKAEQVQQLQQVEQVETVTAEMLIIKDETNLPEAPVGDILGNVQFDFDEDIANEASSLLPAADCTTSFKDIAQSDSQNNLSGIEGIQEQINAKAVECLDMAGNTINIFRSGLLASQAFSIQQEDISLCCRGLKDSINGYRFRFYDEPEPAALSTTTRRDGKMRSTRKSSSYAPPVGRVSTGGQDGLLDPCNIHRETIKNCKVRKWSKKALKVGSTLSAKKWFPLNNQQPNAVLQSLILKGEDGKPIAKVKTNPSNVPQRRSLRR